MKIVLKIFKLFAILIIVVSVILFSASLLLQNKVADIILNSVNRNLSTKLDVGAVRLSFLRKFPKASLELKDVVVWSSSDFVKTSFTGINTDTLLTAKNISVEFRLTDIIKGNYNIESVGAKNGKMNIFTDYSGFINYNISVKTESQENKEFTINLEKIYLSEIEMYYNNLATKLIIKGKAKNGKLKSRISGDNLDFTAEAELEIASFQLFNTTISKPINAGLDLSLESTKDGIMFKRGTITIEDYMFGLEGFVSSENMLDLNVTGKDINLAKIRNYLPEKYKVLAADYNPSGLLEVTCRINGPLTRTNNPHVEIITTLNNGRVSFGKSDIILKSLSFSGYYSNGNENNFRTSSVSFKDLKARLGSSDYTGSLLISDFSRPLTELALSGRVFPGELKEFFKIKNISSAEGYADIDLSLVTYFWPKDSVTFIDIIDLKPEASLRFKSFSLEMEPGKLSVRDVNGTIDISDTISADHLNFTYKGQNIAVDGKFFNLPDWLAGRPVRMTASADLSFDRLNPALFMNNAAKDKNSAPGSTAFSFPGDIVLDLNFKIDSLIYKNFKSANVAGMLTYKPRVLTFKALRMDALRGSVSGTGFIIQDITKSIIARGSFGVSGIDVNQTFKTFNNFGQTFLKSENLAGDLSGNLSVLIPMDSNMKPVINSITAEGKFILTNGALINFDPVKELSDFIELSELENINFDKLENDFFIRNNYLYLPQMDIKSSAADLSVNGKHSLDNEYEYHIKMLLSEILSKKRKNNKSNVTEFGVVQEDGLGRTSIQLKVVGKGEEVKVSYDVKAVSSEIKNNIKTERQTLKSILNQEYGLYKSDTTLNQKPSGKKPRFKISWEETDSTTTSEDQPAIKKKSPVTGVQKRR